MKTRRLGFAIAAFIFFTSFSLSGAPQSASSVQAPQYPQPVITPAAPLDGDTVSLWLVLGENPNSCVPFYGTSFHIVTQHPGICTTPPCTSTSSFTIFLTYCQAMIETFAPIPPGSCAQVVTQYGPRFSFGGLTAGQYTVVDSMTGQTVAAFSVKPNPNFCAISGRVTEENGALPSQPPLAGCNVLLARPTIYWLAVDTLPSPSYYIDQYLPTPAPVDSAITDSNGNFNFPKEPPGEYMLQFSKPGYLARGAYVNVPPAAFVATSLMRANAVASVNGNVYTDAGCKYSESGTVMTCPLSPVAGCTVWVQLPINYVLAKKALAKRADTLLSMPGYIYAAYSAITDVNGWFSIDSIPLDYTNQTVQVSVFREGYEPDSKQVSLYPNSATGAVFVIKPAFSNIVTKTSNGITFAIATEKQEYNKGDQVRTRYWIKNNGATTATFSTPVGCGEFVLTIVNAAGARRYGSLDGVRCGAIGAPLSLLPGDSTGTEFVPYTCTDSTGMLYFTAQLTKDPTSAMTATVVVSTGSTPARPIPAAKITGPSVSYIAAAGRLELSLDKAQNVSVSAFGLNGREIPALSSASWYNAGTHAIPLTRTSTAAGIVLLRVKGEHFSLTKRINLTTGR
jgi:hypothetical protein